LKKPWAPKRPFQSLHVLEGRKKFVHFFLTRHRDALRMVGQIEPLVTNIHGQQDIRVLCQTVCHDERIEDLLGRFREDLNPPVILDQNRVLLAGEDAVRTHLFPHAERHHDREPVAGCKKVRITHERQTLRGGRGEGPASGRARTEKHSHRRILSSGSIICIKQASLNLYSVSRRGV
jgi:hypothetical protein